MQREISTGWNYYWIYPEQSHFKHIVVHKNVLLYIWLQLWVKLKEFLQQ